MDRPELNRTLQEAELGQVARALVGQIASLPYSEYQRIRNDVDGETAQALVEARAELVDLLNDLGMTS